MARLFEWYPIDTLNLPTRARNSLVRAGIITPEELAARSDDELLAIRGFGQTSLEQVWESLAAWEREQQHQIEQPEEEEPDVAPGIEAEVESGTVETFALLPGRQVLHAAWLPGVGPWGCLFLWGEGQPSSSDPSILSSVLAHPFHLLPADLRNALPGRIPEAAEEMRASVRVPLVGDGPQSSPQLIRGFLDQKSDDPEALGCWQVRGLLLQPLDALAFLNDLPRSEELTPNVALGADLDFWSLTGKFALELLARQQFAPTLRLSGDGGATDGSDENEEKSYRAVWVPVLDRPKDLRRVEQLSEAMPTICRAVSPFSSGDEICQEAYVPPSSRALLKDFLGTVTNVTVRAWAPPLLHVVTRRDDPTLRAWLTKLFVKRGPGVQIESVVDAPLDELEVFHAEVTRWQEQLMAGAEEPFRICFRLEPPTLPEQEEDTLVWTSSDGWTLRFFLQARDDPSLLIPASRVWRERSTTLRYLDRRFDNPQEKLLAGLGKAARFFSPLEESLRTARPEASYLDTEQAYTFLREMAPLLEQSDFGVLVPSWWKKQRKRLGVRATVSPADGEGKGLLNLDTLVHFRWNLALGDQDITPQEFSRLAALKVPLVRVRGEWVELQPEQIETAIRFWEKRSTEEETTLRQALRVGLTDRGEVGGLPLVGVKARGWLRDLMHQLDGSEPLIEQDPPQGLNGQLRPYQVRGFSWLDYLHRWGLGACLADDMGLGKTVQAIALMLHDLEEGLVDGPVLVICPTSVVGNWRREIARFAPLLQTLVHHGSDRARGEAFVGEVEQVNVVISTYGLARRDEKTLRQVEWAGIVLDEAQNIKNPATKQTQAIRRLSAGYRVALTGTPVENRLSELWSIMQFLNPGYLGSQKSFRVRFARPIERYQDQKATKQLRTLVRPFILRRVKTDPTIIQDLPDKLENKIYCTLTPEQATLYQAVVEDAMRQVREAEGIQRRGLVLSMLTRLKQICNHPAHFLGDGSSLPGRSGKLDRLGEMLEEVLSVDERALIFTQFAEMGILLQTHLQDLFGGEVLFLYGGTPAKRRDRMIARFQKERHGPAVFVLSLKAGGLGLNLTRANHVFHFDRWWNPAVENQATDRAFRIGQTKDVWVHKFVCAGTLEERIDELIESKKTLAESVVGAGEGWLTELDADQLRQLVTLSQDALGK